MKTRTTNKSQAAAATLGEIGKLILPNEAEKLHGATFEPPTDPAPAEPSPEAPVDAEPSLLDRKITELLDQMGEGLQAEDSTNFEKLNIARKYGPLAWELKALVPHGEFKRKLKERFPKVNYSKVNRWMVISNNETEVAAAIEKYPDVAWGPKKMIDYLKGWNPEEEPEDDEDDSDGFPLEDNLKEEPLPISEEITEPDATSPFVVGALNPDLAAAAEKHKEQVQAGATATAGPVTQAVRTPPRNERTKPRTRPTVNRTEYAVEVSLSFMISVPENVTAEQITAALLSGGGMTLGANPPFDYELSEMTVVDVEVRGTDGLNQFQPQIVPGTEAATE